GAGNAVARCNAAQPAIEIDGGPIYGRQPSAIIGGAEAGIRRKLGNMVEIGRHQQAAAVRAPVGRDEIGDFHPRKRTERDAEYLFRHDPPSRLSAPCIAKSSTMAPPA